MNPAYRRHHPKWYRARMPIFWWFRKAAYFRFIARELTSVFVAYSSVLLLVQLRAVAAGPEALARFTAWLHLRPVVALHVVVLLALLFHTVTWLHLAPRAIVIRLGRRRVPDVAVLLGHYGAWLAASGLVVWLLRL
ncbi:MAG: fumarate reductase subunit C [Gemmatimonadetes bacterium]|nr:fumarate reductase subunit C [Gemmatimonadota bacterium]